MGERSVLLVVLFRAPRGDHDGTLLFMLRYFYVKPSHAPVEVQNPAETRRCPRVRASARSLCPGRERGRGRDIFSEEGLL